MVANTQERAKEEFIKTSGKYELIDTKGRNIPKLYLNW